MPRKPSESAARRDKAAPAPRARATPSSVDTERDTAQTPIPQRAEGAASGVVGAAVPTSDTRERIAIRAYLKWLERGCPPGDGTRDWFEAEEEMRRETEPA